MSTARREYFLLVTGLILLAVTAIAVYTIPRLPSTTKDVAEIKTMITTFGTYPKNIPLQGDPETVRREIQQNYGQFVTAQLLQQWREDPTQAPGRLTSSPWPDRLEIETIVPQGSGYIVTGLMMMMTSTGDAGQIPVVLMVVKENEEWRIAAYQLQNVEEDEGSN